MWVQMAKFNPKVALKMVLQTEQNIDQMKNENITLDSLIKGGLIGAVLGSFLLKDKEEGAIIGGLLGAAISATIKASEEAQKTDVPIYVEEEGKLYKISPPRKKRFIRNLKKPTQNLPDQFKLK
jgi:hypothetical protein